MANGQSVQNTAKGNGLGIRFKMLVVILPTVVLSILIMALMLTTQSSNDVSNLTDQYMKATLKENINDVNAQLDSIRHIAEALSKDLAVSYKYTDISDYATLFQSMLDDNELASGAGIWFEPYAYDASEKYYGPYWYKDGASYVEDWEYSNAEYDYFNQEYYLNAKSLKDVKGVITDPYYDEASNTVMSTCSVPIFDPDNGSFIGCITCDITLDTVQDSLNQVKISNDGALLLVDSTGIYIYNSTDLEAAANAVTLSSDPFTSSVADKVAASDSGTLEYDGKNIYFDTIPEVGWKLAIVVEQAKINEPIRHMRQMSGIILVIAICVCTVFIVWQASSIASAMRKVQIFAKELSKGNFTIEPVDINRNDEIGQMSRSLNEMYRNNADVIRNISHGSNSVNESSNRIDDVAEKLSLQFADVQSSMVRVNDAMSSTGAATEEVSASASEVNESVARLAKETELIAKEVKEIGERAAKIERDGRESSDNAIRIAKERGEALKEASKKATIVSEIGALADSISGIASQINLLSLNASIEAARAGEHGRGFAVVASEINKLATETKEAVDRIQETISAIQEAFNSLSRNSEELLSFVQDTVTPDYDNFIRVGQQYGHDAESFGELTGKISSMVEYIRDSMEQVSVAVGSIAESATETATSSSEVTDIVNEVSGMVSDVSNIAQDQKGVSNTLSDIVSQFRL
ncbi:MAG: methyl-accepting chemotaxis protein [Clostridiales bacterium]|nr:methyl-accepting chemotaxis protein [Clostridiales bacterium]